MLGPSQWHWNEANFIVARNYDNTFLRVKAIEMNVSDFETIEAYRMNIINLPLTTDNSV